MKYSTLIISLLLLLNINASASESFFKPLAVYQNDSLWHFVNYEGNQIFPPQKLQNVFGYNDGMYCVSAMVDGKEKWGYLDSTGKFAIAPKYDKAMLFSEGFAVVYDFSSRLGNQIMISFIDKNGSVINKDDLVDALSFSEGLAFAYTRDGKSGYINKTGEFVIDLKDLVGNRFSEGLSVVTNYDLNAGFIDNTGNVVIPLQYESAKQFSEGFAPVNKNSKYKYINSNGVTVIDGNYDYAHDFKEGRAFIGDLYPKSFMTLWGIIDTGGNLIKDYSYIAVWDFSEGMAAVRDSVAWGFIDKDGKYIIEPVYSFASSFVDGLAWASKKEEGIFGYINKNIEYIIKFNKFEKFIDLRLNKRMY